MNVYDVYERVQGNERSYKTRWNLVPGRTELNILK